MSWKSFFTKQKKQDLDEGLEKTKKSFFSKIANTVAGKSKIDEEVLDNLEEVLVSSDVSVKTTLKIIDRLEQRVKKDKYVGVSELNEILKTEISEMLSENNIEDITGFDTPSLNEPYVIMVVGVNGVGKTTTIGKLAHQFKNKRKNVVILDIPLFLENKLNKEGDILVYVQSKKFEIKNCFKFVCPLKWENLEKHRMDILSNELFQKKIEEGF